MARLRSPTIMRTVTGSCKLAERHRRSTRSPSKASCRAAPRTIVPRRGTPEPDQAIFAAGAQDHTVISRTPSCAPAASAPAWHEAEPATPLRGRPGRARPSVSRYGLVEPCGPGPWVPASGGEAWAPRLTADRSRRDGWRIRDRRQRRLSGHGRTALKFRARFPDLSIGVVVRCFINESDRHHLASTPSCRRFTGRARGRSSILPRGRHWSWTTGGSIPRSNLDPSRNRGRAQLPRPRSVATATKLPSSDRRDRAAIRDGKEIQARCSLSHDHVLHQRHAFRRHAGAAVRPPAHFPRSTLTTTLWWPGGMPSSVLATRFGTSATSRSAPLPARAAAILDALAGEKHLLIGNNDDDATLALPGWASVRAYREIVVDGSDAGVGPLRVPDLERYGAWCPEPSRPLAREVEPDASPIRRRRGRAGFSARHPGGGLSVASARCPKGRSSQSCLERDALTLEPPLHAYESASTLFPQIVRTFRECGITSVLTDGDGSWISRCGSLLVLLRLG